MSEQRRRTINRRNLGGRNSYRICSVAQTDFEIDVDTRARVCVVYYLETSFFRNKGMRDPPGSTGSRWYLPRVPGEESLVSLPETTGTCFSAGGGTTTRDAQIHMQHPLLSKMPFQFAAYHIYATNLFYDETMCAD